MVRFRTHGKRVMRRILLITFQAAAVLALGVSAKAGDADIDLTFDQDILPIFRSKCIRCHAGVEPKAGLNLTSPSSLLTGGDSGAALRIRAAEFSLLYEKISSDEMPPVGQKLTAQEKGLIRKWINEGAAGVSNAASVDQSDAVTGVEHWSFRPPVRPAVPEVPDGEPASNPIDAFILRKLRQQGLTLSPPADRTVLLRRASFDLTGLPPSPEDVERLTSDASEGAYELMIDRLLASEHYGERWGRHWLDVAGFAETAGILSEDRDLPLAFRYRNYVIRSFNEDKPYNRFLQEQIAGDELTDYWTAFETLDQLPEDVIAGITATGFLRTAADPSRPDFNTIKNAASQYYYPTLFDTLQIVCSSTMGLTVQCARCHSHKFDPIPQEDYYRMQAVFMSAYRPDDWIPQMNRRLHIASKKQKEAAAKRNEEVKENVARLKSELTGLKDSFASRIFESRLAKLPEEVRSDVRTALETAADSRTEPQQQLAATYEKQLRPQGGALDEVLAADADYTKQKEQLEAAVAAEERRRWLFDEVRALYDMPGDVLTPLLLRGDALTPGPPVQPGVISSLETPEVFEWTSPGEDAKTSGKRLAFARWLTQDNHPLTSRVMVNRIWMHHFGTGLVDTPDDFGVAGSPPSHPELLDWLATEFVRSGWSIKALHRLILTSAAWQQTSRPTPQRQAAAEQVDPENRLLWRQRMRRVDAESLRDSVLAVSGLLDRSMYVRSLPLARQASGEVIVPDTEPRNRRSVYVKINRLNPETMLQIFDQPVMSVNCTQRSTSTVSTQALTILNGDTMTRAAAAFADRVLQDSVEHVVDRAVMLAWARPVTSSERELLTQFLNEQTSRYQAEQNEKEAASEDPSPPSHQKALADLCHMLMSSNEFVYID